VSVRAELLAEVEATIAEIAGTKNPTLGQHLLDQALNALWVPTGLTEKGTLQQIECVAAMLGGIKPQNEVEGMLAIQMIATHHCAMECLRRTMVPDQSFEGRDYNLRHAAKLLSIFTKQLETLNRHRGKGQQKVTVEHVQVQSGGKPSSGTLSTRQNDYSHRRPSKAAA